MTKACAQAREPFRFVLLPVESPSCQTRYVLFARGVGIHVYGRLNLGRVFAWPKAGTNELSLSSFGLEPNRPTRLVSFTFLPPTLAPARADSAKAAPKQRERQRSTSLAEQAQLKSARPSAANQRETSIEYNVRKAQIKYTGSYRVQRDHLAGVDAEADAAAAARRASLLAS